MRWISITLCLAAACGTADAIAPDLAPDFQFTYVGECGGGSGTAIARRAMITARHVPGLTFGINGEIFTAVQRINHPDYDLAIFLFDRDLPGWYALGTSAPIGSEVVWVGYGGVGYPNFQWHGYDIRYGNYGRHAATNIVHLKWGVFGWPAIVSMLDDNPDAAAVNGDSGGGVFANGRLVGVISYSFNLKGGALPNYGFAVLNGGNPYHGSGAIDLTIPEIRAWVLAHIRPVAEYGPPSRVDPQGSLGRAFAGRTLPLPFFNFFSWQ